MNRMFHHHPACVLGGTHSHINLEMTCSCTPQHDGSFFLQDPDCVGAVQEQGASLGPELYAPTHAVAIMPSVQRCDYPCCNNGG